MLRRAIRTLASRQVPHGGRLTSTLGRVSAEQEVDLIKQCEGRVFDLNERQSCDVELLINGGFSPLEGFMNEGDYDACVESMRLMNNTLWGIPVVLDCDEKPKEGEKWLLRWGETNMGVMEVQSKWQPKKEKEALHAYGTTSIEHPGVRLISMERKSFYMGGKVTGFRAPSRVFPCATPEELRAALPSGDVVAFQCRNPIHRAHFELFMRSLDAPNVSPDGSVVLVHPTVGPTQEDDIPGDTRYRTYLALQEALKGKPEYAERNKKIRWGYLPYSMHMAGPREAIQHMIIRKNYGCTHFIVGRDMAGSKSSLSGEDYYGAYDAQEIAAKFSEELGVVTVPSLNLVSTEEGFLEDTVAKSKGLAINKLSGTEFRKRLRAGEDIPEWFAFPEVVDVLRSEIR